MYDYDRTAAAGGPDPLTMKAFLSEFEMGRKRGLEVPPEKAIVETNLAEDEMVEAAKQVKDLVERIIRMGTSGSVRINPQRAAAKLSQSLSTLFYEGGRATGLSESR